MTEDQQNALYQAYQASQSPNKNSKNTTAYDSFIGTLLTNLGVELNDQNKQEAKLVIDLKKAENLPINRTNRSTMINSAKIAYNAFLKPQLVPPENAPLNGLTLNGLTSTGPVA